MFAMLRDVLAATLAMAGELAAEAPWAAPVLPVLWVGLAWVSVRKGRELGAFLTLVAGLFLFFAVWALTSGNADMDRWQRREFSVEYLYIALFVAFFLLLPALVVNLAVHFVLRASRGRGLGHSEMRPDTGRPVVGSTKMEDDEGAFPLTVKEQRAALARAANQREGEEGKAESSSGQPGTLLVADLVRPAAKVGPEVVELCVGAFGEILSQAAAERGGRLLQNVGNAQVYRFSSARQAVACGRDILARLAMYGKAHPSLPLAARLGAHTGLVLQAEGQVRGRDAALAAALMVTAPPDGFHVSAATYEVLDAPDQAPFEHLGVKRLHGVPERLDIWRLAPIVPDTD